MPSAASSISKFTVRTFPADKDPWLVVLEEPAVPIRERNPKVPTRLADVIDRALEEEPEIPFKTAAALKQALEDAISSEDN